MRICVQVATPLYSPQFQWLVVDIYRAAKRQGKYPPLPTETEVNSCFSIYQNSEITAQKDDFNLFIPAKITKFSGANTTQNCSEVNSKGYLEFE